eukprot:gene6118-7085_t
MHTCIFFISSQPRRPGGGGKDAAKEDKDVTRHRQGRHRSDGKDARQYRGLATGPGVQRKAPEAVIRQTGIVVGKTSRKEPYRASSAESSRTSLLKSPGNRAFWNAYLENPFKLKQTPTTGDLPVSLIPGGVT